MTLGKPLICWVAGHGGTSPGAHATLHDGSIFYEKEYTLKLSMESHSLCKFLGLNSKLIRDKDEKISLEKRGQMTRLAGADLIICQHVNSYDKEDWQDSDVFHLPLDRDGIEVAHAIADAMPKEMHSGRVRPATNDWPRVQNCLSVHLPGPVVILIEYGFCSNQNDLEFLSNPYSVSLNAIAAVCGALRFNMMRSK